MKIVDDYYRRLSIARASLAVPPRMVLDDNIVQKSFQILEFGISKEVRRCMASTDGVLQG